MAPCRTPLVATLIAAVVGFASATLDNHAVTFAVIGDWGTQGIVADNTIANVITAAGKVSTPGVAVGSSYGTQYQASGDNLLAGRNGQTAVSYWMAKACAKVQCDFVINTGDNFYDMGVVSTSDPQWTYSWQNVYNQAALTTSNRLDVNSGVMKWYGVVGNHDYGVNANCDGATTLNGVTLATASPVFTGNSGTSPCRGVKAQIDYTSADPTSRWTIQAAGGGAAAGNGIPYYTVSAKSISKAVSVGFTFIDTNIWNSKYSSGTCDITNPLLVNSLTNLNTDGSLTCKYTSAEMVENIGVDQAGTGAVLTGALGASLTGKQGAFLTKTLAANAPTASTGFTYSILVGHHPIYSLTSRVEPARTLVQKAISSMATNAQPILYLNGHDHILSAIKPQTADGINTVFITSGAGSTSSPADTAGNNGATGLADLGVGCPCTSQAAINAGTCVPAVNCPLLASQYNVFGSGGYPNTIGQSGTNLVNPPGVSYVSPNNGFVIVSAGLTMIRVDFYDIGVGAYNTTFDSGAGSVNYYPTSVSNPANAWCNPAVANTATTAAACAASKQVKQSGVPSFSLIVPNPNNPPYKWYNGAASTGGSLVAVLLAALALLL